MACRIGAVFKVGDKPIGLAAVEVFGLDNVERIDNNIGCDPKVKLISCVRVSICR